MINLLSPASKKGLRAARRNVSLRRYLFAVSSGALAILVVYAIAFWITTLERSAAEKEYADAQEKLKSYSTVIEQGKAYQSNLSIAGTVLSNQVSYSKILTETAKAMPPNTIISNLSLSTKKGIPKETRIDARAKSYEDFLELKKQFGNSPLFTDVRILSTTRASDITSLSGIQKTYPFEATIAVKLTADIRILQ